MSEHNQRVVRSADRGNGNGPPDWLQHLNSPTAAEEPPAEAPPGLVSLGFIRAAIWRNRRYWGIVVLVAVLVGIGLAVTSPKAYQASTTLVLTPGPYDNVNTIASDNLALAKTREVAGLAVQKLGLSESPASFLTTYTITPVASRVFIITASGASANQAILNANAVATAFLQFRADEMQTEQKLVLSSLEQQVSQAERQLGSINSQISQLSGSSSSSASQLASLQAQRTSVQTDLYNLQQAVNGNNTNIQPATAAAVTGSRVLDPAILLAHSKLKPLVLDGAFGLIGGLVLGMGYFAVQALVSDKLRRRDDIAQALGAPIKLSVGNVRTRGRKSVGPGTAAKHDTAIQQIAAYLGRVLSRNRGGLSTLAIVPVDDPHAAALSLVSLATSCANQGRRVVLVDLGRGAPAARILGAAVTGVQKVQADGATLVVAVPEPGDIAPVGPLSGRDEQRSAFTESVTGVCTQSDLVLTLASLDPAFGGDHLSSWATEAVAVVTAGRASWTKVDAVGEMIRMSRTRLVSGVLVGADRSDETLGIPYTLPVEE